eukprot:1836143-Lingulodinium_polyedra.AAC.1
MAALVAIPGWADKLQASETRITGHMAERLRVQGEQDASKRRKTEPSGDAAAAAGDVDMRADSGGGGSSGDGG